MQEPPLGLCPLSDSPFPLALLSLLSLPHLLPLPSLPSLPSLPFLPPLSSLQTMIIREDGYSMPVGQLREPGEAQAAVRQAHFFAPQGPVRDEILFMGDLLRTVAEEGPVDAVVKLLTSAASGKIKREAWEESLTQWMAAGSSSSSTKLCCAEVSASIDVMLVTMRTVEKFADESFRRRVG